VIVGVPKESFPGERRVALTPAVLPQLTKLGLQVLVEAGAGIEAGFTDAAFAANGASIAASRADVFARADIITQVLCHGSNDKTGNADLPLLRKDQLLIGFLRPLGSIEHLKEIADTGAIAFGVELMPRSTRAQAMDALSSMATICGYKAAIIAADSVPRIFPMLTTAAGTVTPARVLVIGAGVAGLQAIATARRLGAVVSGYDVRPAAKEQVQSVGARFVELPLETANAQDARGYATQQDESFYRRQRELLDRVIVESDVVISTAVVPGKKPPILIPAETVKKMTPGSVIVDLAAERGGNCELTQASQDILVNGVKIVGRINLASGVPYHASLMYSRNLMAFLALLVKQSALNLDIGDDIIRDTLLTRNGQIVNERVRTIFSLGPLEAR
jgi:NAD(P) transhydrogenase subunit alpha